MMDKASGYGIDYCYPEDDFSRWQILMRLCARLDVLEERNSSSARRQDSEMLDRETLGWCPEHAFVVATPPASIASMTTAPWYFSCGCPHTKAMVVTYQEAIEIVKSIRHARNSAKFKREGVQINVVQYDSPDEEFESYCRQVKEIFQMEEVRR